MATPLFIKAFLFESAFFAAAAGSVQQGGHLVPGVLDAECAAIDGGAALEEACQFLFQKEHRVHLLFKVDCMGSN